MCFCKVLFRTQSKLQKADNYQPQWIKEDKKVTASSNTIGFKAQHFPQSFTKSHSSQLNSRTSLTSLTEYIILSSVIDKGKALVS